MLLSNEGGQQKQNSSQLQVARPNVWAPFLAHASSHSSLLEASFDGASVGAGATGGGDVGESYDFASHAYVLYFNVAQNRGY